MAPAAWGLEAAGFSAGSHAGALAVAFPDCHAPGHRYRHTGFLGVFESLGKAAKVVSDAASTVTGGASLGTPDDTEAETAAAAGGTATCDWEDMKLGNNTYIWKAEKPDIKYAYDHDLKGKEVKVWWPGRAEGGECNNVKDPKRGCWYRARLLNDVGCRESERCLHVAAHDGEPRHTYTCPTWVRNDDGHACKLPENWQACPPSFVLKRVDSGVPQDFKKALAVQCAKTPEEVEELRNTGGAEFDPKTPQGQEKLAQASKGPKDHCLGGTKDLKDINMIFDIRHNAWYRCGPNFKCEEFDISKIKDASEGVCGGGDQVCRDGELCFRHRVTSKRSTHECVDGKKVFLLSEGDDVAKFAAPAPLPAPPRVPLRRGRLAGGRLRRARQQGSFL